MNVVSSSYDRVRWPTWRWGENRGSCKSMRNNHLVRISHGVERPCALFIASYLCAVQLQCSKTKNVYSSKIQTTFHFLLID